jgi:hypothetical protein
VGRRQPTIWLRFPDRDLVGMHVGLLRKLRNRSIAFDGLVASWSLLIRGHQRARCQAEIPLIVLCKISEPLLWPTP